MVGLLFRLLWNPQVLLGYVFNDDDVSYAAQLDSPLLGIIYFLTAGLCGIGQLIDLILIPGMVEDLNRQEGGRVTTSVTNVTTVQTQPVVQQPYIPPQQGYMPPTQVYMAPQQGYMPPPQAYGTTTTTYTQQY